MIIYLFLFFLFFFIFLFIYFFYFLFLFLFFYLFIFYFTNLFSYEVRGNKCLRLRANYFGRLLGGCQRNLSPTSADVRLLPECQQRFDIGLKRSTSVKSVWSKCRVIFRVLDKYRKNKSRRKRRKLVF